MDDWKPRLTAALAAGASLAWLHWVVAAPEGISAWFDGAVFWSCVAGLATLWGPGATRSASRFGADWYATSSHAERRRFLAFGTVIGLAVGFLSGGGPLRLAGLALLVICGLGLLIVTAQRDIGRFREGERVLVLKWFLLAGFLLSYGYGLAHLVLDDAPRTEEVPGIRVAVLFFFGLVVLAVAHLVRRAARRLE